MCKTILNNPLLVRKTNPDSLFRYETYSVQIRHTYVLRIAFFCIVLQYFNVMSMSLQFLQLFTSYMKTCTVLLQCNLDDRKIVIPKRQFAFSLLNRSCNFHRLFVLLSSDSFRSEGRILVRNFIVYRRNMIFASSLYKKINLKYITQFIFEISFLCLYLHVNFLLYTHALIEVWNKCFLVIARQEFAKKSIDH